MISTNTHPQMGKVNAISDDRKISKTDFKNW